MPERNGNAEHREARSRENGADRFHAMPAEEILNRFDVDPARGLSAEEAEQRRRQHGSNELQEEQVKGAGQILVDQFRSIVIIIMTAAAVLAFLTARWPETIALVAVILVNTAISFFTEYRAARSMEALRQLGEHQAQVRRAGERQDVPAALLVPGDIVLLGQDDLVPADIRLLEASSLQISEAALTGESAAVQKTPAVVEPEAPLHERSCMLYKGTTVAEGEAEGVVVATGVSTELGRISELAAGAGGQSTPLQRRLDQLGRRLAWITLGIAVMVGVAGIAAGRDVQVMIETAIALGIAAIPEGLPIVATIALARGMWLMAKHNALVNRLTAVETLGATSVIFTDKTGTLTENRMLVRTIVTPDASETVDANGGSDAPVRNSDESDSVKRLLRIGALCSNVRQADENEDELLGDPTEVALVKAAALYGLQREEVLQAFPEEQEVPFSSEHMLMATIHRREEAGDQERFYTAVKGAPTQVLQACSSILQEGEATDLSEDTRDHWNRRADELAAEGFRLLAFAEKSGPEITDEPYENLCFIGLAGLEDPPRQDVGEAIEHCRSAGIRVVMVTGDRPDTGSAIAAKVGLDEDGKTFVGRELSSDSEVSEDTLRQLQSATVFARVTPEQKYNLVKWHQDHGWIVAMTGDGINDAPALKQADIGVAMGQRGTDAARQVADMVLRDDKFSTIAAAVEQGRIIFANIRKSVLFMLCTNIAEIIAVTVASLAQIPIPLLPLQILFLNVLTDVLPALALGVGTGTVQVMQHPPRSAGEPVLTGHHWRAIGGWSTVISLCVLAALSIALVYLGYDEKRAVTISFLTLAFAKLWFVLNLRDRRAPIWNNDIIRNPWIWGAWLVCVILLLAAVYWPPLASVLQTEPPGPEGWYTIGLLSLVPVSLSLLVPGIRFYSADQR